jgi:hypothetical protein
MRDHMSGWTGPFESGDTVVVYNGPVYNTNGVVGTIKWILEEGLMLHVMNSPWKLWFPRAGVFAMRQPLNIDYPESTDV